MDPAAAAALNASLGRHMLGLYTINLHSAALVETDLQRKISTKQVNKIKKSIMESGIQAGEELHAILVSDVEELPDRNFIYTPICNLQVIMISGQHRARAVKVACLDGFNSADAIWPCYLYKPGE
jgi:hypothetical protein